MAFGRLNLRHFVMALTLPLLFAGALLLPAQLLASTPSSGSISPGTPKATWTGSFVASNPVACISVSGVDPTCDRFTFTLQPPSTEFVLTVRVVPQSTTDDFDLFLRDASGTVAQSSANATGVEEITIFNPPAGTYTVVVQPFVVVPGAKYDGVAGIGSPPQDEPLRAYQGVSITPDFAGVPTSTPAKNARGPNLKVSFNPVGRRAAEPTIGINKNNAGFFVASDFDFPSAGAPRRLARSVVFRSRDKGRTWQAVSPAFNLSEEVPVEQGEPPFTLDPMIHVDTVTGRVYSVDLLAACGAYTVFSDDEGQTWSRIAPFACDTPVNDHHTIITASPPSGLSTTGYPNMLYFCFNRVSDSSCNRSHDGGLTFVPSGPPAFTGVDAVAGGFCGGLHGHLAADSTGRIFLPKGHCELPWVAGSQDGGQNWTRVNISKHVPIEDHEVSLAVDTADNIYAVWADRKFRLPMLSVSRDHGNTWSTPLAFAPPGVREVNFPTIVAGDPGRIAVLFPGSQSTDFTDLTRPWNMYTVLSVNALDTNPTFLWTTANNPADPVHRGHCGPGRCDAEGDGGGSMFDFLDIQVSPADGAFWGTASDTCTGACVTNPQPSNLRPGDGFSIRQTGGPALFQWR